MEEIPKPSGHKIPYFLQIKLAERKKEQQQQQQQQQQEEEKNQDQKPSKTINKGKDGDGDADEKDNGGGGGGGGGGDIASRRRIQHLHILDPTALEAPRLSHPHPISSSSSSSSSSNGSNSHNNNYYISSSINQLPVQERKDKLNRTFSAYELEERMYKTTAAIVNIQKQLHRGEEVYYEDTYNHGNVFRGWDGLVDLKDVVAVW